MRWYLDGGPTMHVVTLLGVVAVGWALARVRRRTWRMWIDGAVAFAAAMLAVACTGSSSGLMVAFSAVAKADPSDKQVLLLRGIEMAQRPLIWAALWCALLLAVLVAAQLAAPPADRLQGRGSWGTRAAAMVVLGMSGAVPPLALASAWGSFAAVTAGAMPPTAVSGALGVTVVSGLGVLVGCTVYGALRVTAAVWSWARG